MDVSFHRNFVRSYHKLSLKQQKRVDETIRVFMNDPHDHQLKNHSLHGDQLGRRAISAGGDLRLVFIETNNYKAIQFLRVGSHNQVYK